MSRDAIVIRLIREGYRTPEVRALLLAKLKASGKGGAPGQWSARKAQLLVQEYERRGGGYTGKKTATQKSLSRWTKQDWGTKSGKPSTQGPDATGERYLPRKARDAMSDEEYARTTAAKRRALRAGKQFSRQPEQIAKKSARFRG